MNNSETVLTHPFPPVYDRESRLLILGSFPSVKSREEGFYYGNPRNRFWKILEIIFNTELRTIEEKKAFLLSRHIALWDCIASCRIHASSDSSITDAIPNDIASLLKKSRIERIITNGNKAYEVYMKYICPMVKTEVIRLPSTSPAHCNQLKNMHNIERVPATSGVPLKFGLKNSRSFPELSGCYFT